LYRPRDCVTPQEQFLENWKIHTEWKALKDKVQFETRLKSVEEFNKSNKWRKRGIYITGLKYGVCQSYNTGATAHLTLYDDGSVFVTHGGCDPGTGVNTKVAQAVALTLGIPYDSVRIGETTTDIIPKTGWNGGSSATDAHVEAARRASVQLKERLAKYKLDLWSKSQDHKEPTFKEVVAAATADNVLQTASDSFVPLGTRSSEMMGPPWHLFPCQYHACGVGCSEVELDVLTGEVVVLRSDINVDVGDTLNPLIDIGQSEGGFVCGLGYFLQEEELTGFDGSSMHNSTWTYKPPLGLDIPKEFNVELAKDSVFPKNVMGFKGVGEPPMILSYSVVGAIEQAIFSSRAERGLPAHVIINSPLTIDKRSEAAQVSSQHLQF